MTPEEKLQLNELVEFKKNLERSSTIPLSIDQAFRERFPNSTTIRISAKGNNSEDQAVNEGGVANYNVLKEPDDFLEVDIDGATYYLPVFTALT